VGDILVEADYPAIRAKIGVQAEELPDTEIETIGLLTAAETLIKQAATDWATLTGANRTNLKIATVALAAAMAITPVRVKRGQSFQIAEYRESETKADWDTMRAELLQESRMYLLMISTNAILTRLEIERWYARITPIVVDWLKDDGFMRYGWENMP
jgi:hypothetical protein